MRTVTFKSNQLDKEIIAKVLEDRKYTVKLKLEDGNIIIKKRKQINETC